jgi:hypothetical protein
MNSNELKLSVDSFLLSETDEKGIIRYANEEFCQFAEYKLRRINRKTTQYCKTCRYAKGCI